MEDKPVSPKDDLMMKMDALFVLASKVEYQTDHLLPVIQASKSIIGINPNNPPRNLLKWLEQYIKNFVPDYQIPDIKNGSFKPEIVTYTELEKLIRGNAQEANQYLGHLIQVADLQHIAEFFVEVASDYNPKTTLFCWLAYKSVRFMKPKDCIPILYICLNSFFDKESEPWIEKLDNYIISLYFYKHEILKSEMIRKKNILPKFERMVLEIEKNRKSIKHPSVLIDLPASITKDGLDGLHVFFNEIEMVKITPDLVILLDSIRSAIKFSDSPIQNCVSELTLKRY